MAKRLFNQRANVELALAKLGRLNDNLTTLEWETMEAVSIELETIASASTLLGADTEVTLSMIVPCLNKIKKSLTKPVKKANAVAEKLRMELLSTLQERFKDELIPSSLVFIATALDIRVKNLATDATWKELKRLVQARRDEILTHQPNYFSGYHSARAQAEYEDNSSLMNFVSDEIATVEEEPKLLPIDKQISNYIGMEQEHTDPIIWFLSRKAQFPDLHDFAVKVLSIQASEVASERAFSLAGRIYSKERASMSPDTFRDIMNIFANDPTISKD